MQIMKSYDKDIKRLQECLQTMSNLAQTIFSEHNSVEKRIKALEDENTKLKQENYTLRVKMNHLKKLQK